MTVYRPAYWVMGSLSVLVALASFRFLLLGLAPAFSGMLSHLETQWLAFVVHVSLAPLALILGVLQFSPRQRKSTAHRWIGRAYGVSVLASGVAGFAIALDALGGPIAASGFALLAVVWVGVTLLGIVAAVNRDYDAHRKWMIRSFALTLAGVTLRLQLLGFMFSGMEYEEASVYLAWSCWLPNLIAAEWWLRRARSQRISGKSE